MKVSLHLPDGISDGLLINNFFVSSDIVGNAIKFLPFFVASLVIVFGIVGFIIGIVGHIGWIVLGLTIGAIIIEIFILRWMLHLHH